MFSGHLLGNDRLVSIIFSFFLALILSTIINRYSKSYSVKLISVVVTSFNSGNFFPSIPILLFLWTSVSHSSLTASVLFLLKSASTTPYFFLNFVFLQRWSEKLNPHVCYLVFSSSLWPVPLHFRSPSVLFAVIVYPCRLISLLTWSIAPLDIIMNKWHGNPWVLPLATSIYCGQPHPQ